MAKDTLSFVDVRLIAYNKNPNNNTPVAFLKKGGGGGVGHYNSDP